MKTLKINQIEKIRLSEKEMNLIQGGDIVTCSCSCYYENQGGSGTMANGEANMYIPGGGKSVKGEWKVKLIADQRVLEYVVE